MYVLSYMFLVREEWCILLTLTELELELYLLDRQLHNIGEIIRKCEIILSGDSHKGTNWPLS